MQEDKTSGIYCFFKISDFRYYISKCILNAIYYKTVLNKLLGNINKKSTNSFFIAQLKLEGFPMKLLSFRTHNSIYSYRKNHYGVRFFSFYNDSF